MFSLEVISRGAALAAEITLTLHGAQLDLQHIYCQFFAILVERLTGLVYTPHGLLGIKLLYNGGSH